MALEPITLLQDKQVVLGVTGSIAAYKAADLASKLTQYGAQVDVILTEAAGRFVTALTFEAVTGRAVYTDLWKAQAGGGLPTHIAHVGLAEGADLLVIAPATADVLARLAHGFAHDLLSITALAARCPVVIAPAMDGTMYQHPAVAANVRLLVERGVYIVEPEEGRFASGLVGKGRLPETATLVGAIRAALGKSGVLTGKRIVVTAGGTREPLDPVRYLTNRSSGKQGYALAQAALDMGADVTLITAARGLVAPYGATTISVESAADMLEAVLTATAEADVLIMAAAVADFRPAEYVDHKIKKTDSPSDDAPTLALVKTDDILQAISHRRADLPRLRAVVGFAAESDNLLQNARGKLERKGLNLIVANDITAADAGFEVDTNRVTLIDGQGEMALALTSKAQVAEAVMERVAALLK